MSNLPSGAPDPLGVVERLRYARDILSVGAAQPVNADIPHMRLHVVRAKQMAALLEEAAKLIAAAESRVSRLEGALKDARSAIASLDDEALGWANDDANQWPIKHELLSNIDAALSLPNNDGSKCKFDDGSGGYSCKGNPCILCHGPTPARVADREALLRLCSIASIVAFNDDATKEELQELGNLANAVKRSLLDKGGAEMGTIPTAAKGTAPLVIRGSAEAVEKLRALALDLVDWHGATMKRWDSIRHQVETLKGSDAPRLDFESLMDDIAETINDAIAEPGSPVASQPSNEADVVPNLKGGATPDGGGV